MRLKIPLFIYFFKR